MCARRRVGCTAGRSRAGRGGPANIISARVGRAFRGRARGPVRARPVPVVLRSPSSSSGTATAACTARCGPRPPRRFAIFRRRGRLVSRVQGIPSAACMDIRNVLHTHLCAIWLGPVLELVIRILCALPSPCFVRRLVNKHFLLHTAWLAWWAFTDSVLKSYCY